MGRPSIFSEDLAETIADRLAGGESLAQIGADDAMPSLRTMIRWSNEREDFGTIYAHAREAQAEGMDEKILTTADKATSETAAADRVKIDAYKWRAARLNPRKFGDRMGVDVNGDIKVTQDETAVAVRIASLVATALGRDAEPD